MTGPDPIGRDVRRERARRRLPPDAACLMCGQTDPEVLRRARRSLLERHHIAGAVNDPDLTATLCLNCHRRMSARLPSAGVTLDRSARLTRIERAVGRVHGLAVFLEQLARSLRAWALDLEETVVDLDREHPGWRSIEPQGGDDDAP
jgi:hypothetical protein